MHILIFSVADAKAMPSHPSIVTGSGYARPPGIYRKGYPEVIKTLPNKNTRNMRELFYVGKVFISEF